MFYAPLLALLQVLFQQSITRSTKSTPRLIINIFAMIQTTKADTCPSVLTSIPKVQTKIISIYSIIIIQNCTASLFQTVYQWFDRLEPEEFTYRAGNQPPIVWRLRILLGDRRILFCLEKSWLKQFVMNQNLYRMSRKIIQMAIINEMPIAIFLSTPPKWVTRPRARPSPILLKQQIPAIRLERVLRQEQMKIIAAIAMEIILNNICWWIGASYHALLRILISEQQMSEMNEFSITKIRRLFTFLEWSKSILFLPILLQLQRRSLKELLGVYLVASLILQTEKHLMIIEMVPNIPSEMMRVRNTDQQFLNILLSIKSSRWALLCDNQIQPSNQSVVFVINRGLLMNQRNELQEKPQMRLQQLKSEFWGWRLREGSIRYIVEKVMNMLSVLQLMSLERKIIVRMKRRTVNIRPQKKRFSVSCSIIFMNYFVPLSKPQIELEVYIFSP